MCVPPGPVVKAKMYRPCRRKKKKTLHSRRGRNYSPSRPVVKNYMHRPVPSRQFLLTVPSRRDNFFLRSCPVPSRHKKVVVLYRPVPSTKSHLPSSPVHYVTVPSRPVCIFFPTKHVKTVPSRPVSDITSHEKSMTDAFKWSNS